MGNAEPGDRTPPATAKMWEPGSSTRGRWMGLWAPNDCEMRIFCTAPKAEKKPMNCEIPIFLDFSSLEMHQNHIPELRPEPWATLHAALSQAL